MREFLKILVVGLAVLIFQSCDNSSKETTTDAVTTEEMLEESVAEEVTEEPESVEAHSGAEISFESEVFEFGEVNQGEFVTHKFSFTNTGSRPLVINDARGSCGCTVPEWPKDPIAPGASGIIDVKFNSSNKKGPQEKSVYLETNVSKKPVILKIKGNVNVPEKK